MEGCFYIGHAQLHVVNSGRGARASRLIRSIAMMSSRFATKKKITNRSDSI